MRWVLLLLVLSACVSQSDVLTSAVIAEPAKVVFPCRGFGVVGESCQTDCDCAKPTKCISDRCALTGLSDGELCASNKQCLSQYCSQLGRCGGPDTPTAKYDCEKVCKSSYDGTGQNCYTVCKFD